MAAAKPAMQVADKATAKEWFQVIEDGVPEDLGVLWLEREATGNDAPQEYRDSWRKAVNEDDSKTNSLREAWRKATSENSSKRKGVTEAEYTVLRMYTMDMYKFYRKFNSDCRERKWKIYRVYTSLLHSALSKLRRKSSDEVQTLYRGLNCSIEETKNNICMPCFTSTTQGPEITNHFGSGVVTIKARTGPAIDEFSEFYEKETLFSPFQVFVALADKSMAFKTDINETLPFLTFPLFRGSLLGAVVGNCIGGPFEFAATPTIETLLTTLGQNENNAARKGSWRFTSDTSMILALAESLVRARQLDIRDLSKSLSDAYKRDSNRNFGGNAALLLEELHQLTPTDDPFGPAQRVCNGAGSFGNGGAMRIVPAALLNWNATEANFNNEIGQITRLTHSNISGVNGAILQAMAVQSAIKFSIFQERNQTNRELYVDQLIKQMQSIETSGNRPYCGKLKTVKGFLSKQPTLETIQRDLGNGLSAQDAVPTAIYCFLRGMQPIPEIPENRTEFERTIIYAISLGGDTDTIASMAGAIAGAYYGQDSIPQKWRDICEPKAIEDAKRYAKQIHGLVYN